MYGSPCNSPRIIALVNAYSASFPFITLFSFNVNWGVKGMALGIIFEGNEILDNRFFFSFYKDKEGSLCYNFGLLLMLFKFWIVEGSLFKSLNEIRNGTFMGIL